MDWTGNFYISNKEKVYSYNINLSVNIRMRNIHRNLSDMANNLYELLAVEVNCYKS